MRLTENREGVIIEVFVKPNSPKFEVKLENEEIVVRSTEEPTKGKVNKEIVKELSRLFKTKVELVSGSTSRQKRLLIIGVDKKKVEEILSRQ